MMAGLFDGADYDPARDDARLGAQLDRIWVVMADGAWRTLTEIARLADAPEASVSAQLRHLRKARFGAHGVDKTHVGRGLYRYRLVPNPASMPAQQGLF